MLGRMRAPRFRLTFTQQFLVSIVSGLLSLLNSTFCTFFSQLNFLFIQVNFMFTQLNFMFTYLSVLQPCMASPSALERVRAMVAHIVKHTHALRLRLDGLLGHIINNRIRLALYFADARADASIGGKATIKNFPHAAVHGVAFGAGARAHPPFLLTLSQQLFVLFSDFFLFSTPLSALYLLISTFLQPCMASPSALERVRVMVAAPISQHAQDQLREEIIQVYLYVSIQPHSYLHAYIFFCVHTYKYIYIYIYTYMYM